MPFNCHDFADAHPGQIGPWSPDAVLRSTLPPRLRASHLSLEDEALTPDRHQFNP